MERDGAVATHGIGGKIGGSGSRGGVGVVMPSVTVAGCNILDRRGGIINCQMERDSAVTTLRIES